MSKVRRKLFSVYISSARSLWAHLPVSVCDSRPGRAFGGHLYRTVSRHSCRNQSFATFFLRNRAELVLLTQLLEQKEFGARVDLSILACSKGAELYSIAWAIHTLRPDLQLKLTAVDICRDIVDFASAGIYAFGGESVAPGKQSEIGEARSVEQNTAKDQNTWIFGRMSSEEIEAMFEVDGNLAIVRPHLRHGITWMCADAANPSLREEMGPQDIVVANRFLCHMTPRDAETCLDNIAQLVRPGGYLFVSGIDLDLRTRVAVRRNLQPVRELLREVHDGDISIRQGWPMEYWGLEPLDDRRRDWQIRYASVFECQSKPPEKIIPTPALGSHARTRVSA